MVHQLLRNTHLFALPNVRLSSPVTHLQTSVRSLCTKQAEHKWFLLTVNDQFPGLSIWINKRWILYKCFTESTNRKSNTKCNTIGSQLQNTVYKVHMKKNWFLNLLQVHHLWWSSFCFILKWVAYVIYVSINIPVNKAKQSFRMKIDWVAFSVVCTFCYILIFID